MQHHQQPPKAKLFQHGRSQAVRLPKEFRFEGTEVFVRKVGDDVILSSRAKPSMRVLIEALDEFDDSIQLLERNQPAEVDRRETFDRKGRR
jgi:antitoxin VapB